MYTVIYIYQFILHIYYIFIIRDMHCLNKHFILNEDQIIDR